ncbi:MAG: glycosyltransferase [Pirellulaceae bacterium]
MNVLMMTNTYLPQVCGVARSVVTFSTALRERGHRVLIVAPSNDGAPDDEPDVVRVPAIQHLMSNDIPLRLPIPGYLSNTLQEFQPQIVHVHHPFLLGNTGLRVAASWNLPVVFTYHTMYEHYTHYIPGDSCTLERFTIRLATEFANLCDHVIAPSESVASVLHERNVRAPVSVVPTGIDTAAFGSGSGPRSRLRHGIPGDAFVVGHVGRLVLEKNLEFLAQAVCRFLQQQRSARFFVVGDGPMRSEIQSLCERAGVGDRLHLSDGELEGQDLNDAYAAMNVMAFASQSDTQGMVLAEGMAAGLPVVAVDAPGARDIVRDRANGRLLAAEHVGDFAAALEWVRTTGARDERVRRTIQATAENFSMERSVERLEGIYRAVRRASTRHPPQSGKLQTALQRIGEEYQIWSRMGHALYDAAFGSRPDIHHPDMRHRAG